MKSTQPKNIVANNSKHSPFFQKESSNIFFAKRNKSFFTSSPIQAKLTVNQPNDNRYDQEADVMADKIVQRLVTTESLTNNKKPIQAKPVNYSITPLIQTKCAVCGQEQKLQKKETQDEKELLKAKLQKKPTFESNAELQDDERNIQRICAACEKEEQKLQAKPDASSTQTVSPSIETSLSSTKENGNPILAATRSQMENSFGADFSGVRIYNDNSAAKMSKNLQAHAFTHGNDIYFNSCKYDTNSTGGKHLLAHELSHVVQQNNNHSTINKSIQMQALYGSDRIHDPLLDEYSNETGLPRNTVTQHDPSYEVWLRNRSSTTTSALATTVSPVLSIIITLDMSVPAANPAADYTRSETQIGAWEKANLLLAVQQSFSCDRIVNNGIESSFVTDIGIRFTRADFEYFIARHIYENMNDRARHISELIIWRRIHGRIIIHANEHFTRYREVVATMQQDFQQGFSALPNRNSPIQISQQDLETYVSALLQYLIARLHFELWQTTCSWEHTDYPNLLRGIPNISGRFVPACGTSPSVPPEPLLPIVVTSSPGRVGTPPRRRP